MGKKIIESAVENAFGKVKLPELKLPEVKVNNKPNAVQIATLIFAVLTFAVVVIKLIYDLYMDRCCCDDYDDYDDFDFDEDEVDFSAADDGEKDAD